MCNNNELKRHIDLNSFYFIAVGSSILRKKIYLEIKSYKIKKFRPIKIISSNSCIDSTVKIGDGTLIMPGVIINCNSKIGNYTIINTSSSLDHDNIIKNFSTIAPGVNTAGNVRINDSCTIGIGTKIKENITIGKNTTVGASSYVNKNCKPNSFYLGIPIKKYEYKTT